MKARMQLYSNNIDLNVQFRHFYEENQASLLLN